MFVAVLANSPSPIGHYPEPAEFGPYSPKPIPLTSILILRCIDPLLGNASNTHAANNTGVVLYVVLAAIVDMQRAMHAGDNTEAAFSVLWSDPRLYSKKTTITESSVGRRNSSRAASSGKKMK
jgi:hypothetical protein